MRLATFRMFIGPLDVCEVPVHVFCQFSIRLVVFFFMICTTSVYILKMTYLPDIHYEYYFPFCELSIFILLMVSF